MAQGMRSFIRLILLAILFTFSAWANADTVSVYGPTTPHEGLYRIALKVQTSKTVTIDQVMIALFQANLNAFNDNNINGLKLGYKLTVPSLAQIQTIPATAASAEVRRQNQKWRRGGHFAKPAQVRKINAKNQKNKSQKIADLKSNSTSVEAYNSFANTIAGALDQVKQQMSQLVNKEQLEAVQNQLMQNEKQNAVFKDEIKQQLTQTEQKNQALTTQVQQMTQQVDSLSAQMRQLDQVQKQQDEIITNKVTKALNIYMADLQSRYGAYAIITFIVLVILWFTPCVLARFKRKRKHAAEKANKAEIDLENDTKDEYDFMNSDEGIPAKLDLARAYIDMEDFTAAETELKVVLKKGNILQKQEAERLLKKIK